MSFWPDCPPIAIPGMKAPPLIGKYGNLLRLLNDPVRLLPSLHQRFGKVAALVENNPGVVCAFGPELNQQVLADPKAFSTITPSTLKMPEDSSLHRLLNGIVSMNGQQHAQHRRLMNPAFHRRAVESYHRGFVAAVETTLASWKPGEVRDISHEMERLTMEVALTTIFGMTREEAAQDHVPELLERFIALLGSPAATMLPWDFPGSPRRKLFDTAVELERRFRSLISRKRQVGAQGTDSLSLLIQATDEEDGKTKTLTDDELLGHAFILFLAGHHTTAAALSWTVFLLDQHPDYLGQLHEELAPLNGAAPEISQVDKLPLLEAAIKESMRLLPPGSFQLRVGNAPFQLGGFELPKGGVVVYSSYVTHRLPELYSDPQRFRPERWSSLQPNPFEYLPFGAGPRKCVGSVFAMFEMKVALAMILQRFRLTVAPGLKLDRQAVPALRPRRGLPMKLHSRHESVKPAPVRGNVHEMVELPS